MTADLPDVSAEIAAAKREAFELCTQDPCICNKLIPALLRAMAKQVGAAANNVIPAVCPAPHLVRAEQLIREWLRERAAALRQAAEELK